MLDLDGHLRAVSRRVEAAERFGRSGSSESSANGAGGERKGDRTERESVDDLSRREEPPDLGDRNPFDQCCLVLIRRVAAMHGVVRHEDVERLIDDAVRRVEVLHLLSAKPLKAQYFDHPL